MTSTTLLPDLEGGARTPSTTRCPVKLALTDGRILAAELFLLSDSARPGGVTNVETTLDGARDFMPLCLDERNVLIGLDAILYVEVAQDAPGTGELLELSGSFDMVTLTIDTGETLSGVLRFPAPADAMRMSDMFNRHGRFLTLTTGDLLILVSKAHVVEAAF